MKNQNDRIEEMRDLIFDYEDRIDDLKEQLETLKKNKCEVCDGYGILGDGITQCCFCEGTGKKKLTYKCDI